MPRIAISSVSYRFQSSPSPKAGRSDRVEQLFIVAELVSILAQP